MTVSEAIEKVDALQPNMFTKADKVGWLSHLDMRVQHQILDTHEYNDGETEIHFEGYTTDGNDDTEMLAPVPYDEMYIHWLEAQINYYNMEYDGFNAANLLFNTNWDEFRNWYNKYHMPKTARKSYHG